jgi:hypothetical protein
MMDAASECDMTARNLAIENDVIRVVERGCVSVCRSPEQEDSRVFGDGNAAEVRVMNRGTQQEAKR